jgi:hypothetical protein
METASDGDRRREVVQFDQRLWVHSAARRRQGRFRPYFGGREAGLSTLNEGQQVQYEEVANKGKTSAENPKVNCAAGRDPAPQPIARAFFH